MTTSSIVCSHGRPSRRPASRARPTARTSGRAVVRRHGRRARLPRCGRSRCLGCSRGGDGHPAAGRVPDLVVACGGVWSSMPPSLVALSLADMLRRTGASTRVRPCRAAGALGAIPMRRSGERLPDRPTTCCCRSAPWRQPPASGPGMRPVGSSSTDRELTYVSEVMSGEPSLVRLGPGESAVAESSSCDNVRLGGRARQFAIDVAVVRPVCSWTFAMRRRPLLPAFAVDARREQLRHRQAAVLPVGLS